MGKKRSKNSPPRKKARRQQYSDALKALCHRGAIRRSVRTAMSYAKHIASHYYHYCANSSCDYWNMPQQEPPDDDLIEEIERQRQLDELKSNTGGARSDGWPQTTTPTTASTSTTTTFTSTTFTTPEANVHGSASSQSIGLTTPCAHVGTWPNAAFSVTPEAGPSTAVSTRTSSSQIQLDQDYALALQLQEDLDKEDGIAHVPVEAHVAAFTPPTAPDAPSPPVEHSALRSVPSAFSRAAAPVSSVTNNVHPEPSSTQGSSDSRADDETQRRLRRAAMLQQEGAELLDHQRLTVHAATPLRSTKVLRLRHEEPTTSPESPPLSTPTPAPRNRDGRPLALPDVLRITARNDPIATNQERENASAPIAHASSTSPANVQPVLPVPPRLPSPANTSSAARDDSWNMFPNAVMRRWKVKPRPVRKAKTAQPPAGTEDGEGTSNRSMTQENVDQAQVANTQAESEGQTLETQDLPQKRRRSGSDVSVISISSTEENQPVRARRRPPIRIKREPDGPVIELTDSESEGERESMRRGLDEESLDSSNKENKSLPRSRSNSHDHLSENDKEDLGDTQSQRSVDLFASDQEDDDDFPPISEILARFAEERRNMNLSPTASETALAPRAHPHSEDSPPPAQPDSAAADEEHPASDTVKTPRGVLSAAAGDDEHSDSDTTNARGLKSRSQDGPRTVQHESGGDGEAPALLEDANTDDELPALQDIDSDSEDECCPYCSACHPNVPHTPHTHSNGATNPPARAPCSACAPNADHALGAHSKASRPTFHVVDRKLADYLRVAHPGADIRSLNLTYDIACASRKPVVEPTEHQRAAWDTDSEADMEEGARKPDGGAEPATEIVGQEGHGSSQEEARENSPSPARQPLSTLYQRRTWSSLPPSSTSTSPIDHPNGPHRRPRALTPSDGNVSSSSEGDDPRHDTGNHDGSTAADKPDVSAGAQIDKVTKKKSDVKANRYDEADEREAATDGPTDDDSGEAGSECGLDFDDGDDDVEEKISYLYAPFVVEPPHDQGKPAWTHDFDSVTSWLLKIYIWTMDRWRPSVHHISVPTRHAAVYLTDGTRLKVLLRNLGIRKVDLWDPPSTSWIDHHLGMSILVAEDTRHTLLVRLPDVRHCPDFADALLDSMRKETAWTPAPSSAPASPIAPRAGGNIQAGGSRKGKGKAIVDT